MKNITGNIKTFIAASNPNIGWVTVHTSPLAKALRAQVVPNPPRIFTDPLAQEQYERGWRAGWQSALRGNFRRLRAVELGFADGLADPEDEGFLDAWDKAEYLELVPDPPASPTHPIRIVPA